MRPVLSVIALLLGSIVDTAAVSAQQSDRVYRIGWLSIGRPDREYLPIEKWTGSFGAFRDALRDSGYVVGKNLIVDVRRAHGEKTRLAAEAESLVASNVDVIVTIGSPPTIAAMRATKRTPIVFAW